MRGIVRPVLFAVGAAVTVAASTVGRLLDQIRPDVDDTCACRRHRRPHRTSTPRSTP
jgi:hypothetical protein